MKNRLHLRRTIWRRVIVVIENVLYPGRRLVATISKPRMMEWCCMPIMPAFQRQTKQEIYKFWANIWYTHICSVPPPPKKRIDNQQQKQSEEVLKWEDIIHSWTEGINVVEFSRLPALATFPIMYSGSKFNGNDS